MEQCKYKGWIIKAYHIAKIKPFLEFNATCYKTVRNKVFMFNVDGNSIKQVIDIAKDTIDGNKDNN